jgi:hypothetical protein
VSSAPIWTVQSERRDVQIPTTEGPLSESLGPFVVLPTPVNGLSAILTGVGDDVTEADGEHDDGGKPKRVNGETDKAKQQGNGHGHDHDYVRDPALTEQRGDASRLLRSGRHHREPLFRKMVLSS